MKAFWQGFEKRAAPKWLKMLRAKPEMFSHLPVHQLERSATGRVARTFRPGVGTEYASPGADWRLTRGGLFADIGEPLRNKSYQDMGGLKRKLTKRLPDGTFQQAHANIPHDRTTMRHTDIDHDPVAIKAYKDKMIRDLHNSSENSPIEYRIIGSKKNVPVKHYSVRNIQNDKIRNYGISANFERGDASKMYTHLAHTNSSNLTGNTLHEINPNLKVLHSEVPESSIIYRRDTMGSKGVPEAIVPIHEFNKNTTSTASPVARVRNSDAKAPDGQKKGEL